MSEFINNSEERQELLKSIIKKIHDGMDLVDAKALFKKHFSEVSTDEITKMEQSLMMEGMPIEEVQRLCDVHAAVFEGSISDIHKAKELTDIKGHPAKVFHDENTKIEKLIKDEIEEYLGKFDRNAHLMLRIGIERLLEISKHYARKENLFFPGLEKRGITSVPKVMWAVDNQILDMLKDVKKQMDLPEMDFEKVNKDIKAALQKVKDMITKENNILLPMLIDTLSLYDWILADEGSDEIGYFIDPPLESWAEKSDLKTEEAKSQMPDTVEGEVAFDAGFLNGIELNSILNTLPLDMTFVDKDDHVKYFTQGKERIFNRPLTVLGRHVSMCHPPQSVHIVEEIVNSFKDGSKDNEDFYINLGNLFVYIRYFAVRDKNQNYLGTLEITQNIKPIRDLEGEKRLVSK